MLEPIQQLDRSDEKRTSHRRGSICPRYLREKIIIIIVILMSRGENKFGKRLMATKSTLPKKKKKRQLVVHPLLAIKWPKVNISSRIASNRLIMRLVSYKPSWVITISSVSCPHMCSYTYSCIYKLTNINTASLHDLLEKDGTITGYDTNQYLNDHIGRGQRAIPSQQPKMQYFTTEVMKHGFC